MKAYFDAVGAPLPACFLTLILVVSGCGALDEMSDSEPTPDIGGGWATEYRANDKESRPLGVSSRARDIERSVGVR